MKRLLNVRVTRTFDDQPLAVLDLPGDGAELRVHQLRDLAVALAQIADAIEGRKTTHRGKPLPDARMVIELGQQKGGAAAASGC